MNSVVLFFVFILLNVYFVDVSPSQRETGMSSKLFPHFFKSPSMKGKLKFKIPDSQEVDQSEIDKLFESVDRESNEDLTFSSKYLKNPTSLPTHHADTDNFKLFTHLTGDGTCNKPWTVNKIPFCCATRFFHYRRFCRYIRATGHLPHHRQRRKHTRKLVDVPHIHTPQTMQLGGWIG